MRDILLDLVAHTYDLGGIDLVKIVGEDNLTSIEAIADDRSVVIQGTFNKPVEEFTGTFGMPNLSKLKIILGIPEYKSAASISILHETKAAGKIPASMNFVNTTGDFKNDYRFMESTIVQDVLKTVRFKGANWKVEFEPTAAAIQRLKYQANANAEELVFTTRTTDGDLYFCFGDHSTHAGNFVFQTGISGVLTHEWAWPIKQISNIFDLPGDKTMYISDEGAAQITVKSGLATYNYIILAQSK